MSGDDQNLPAIRHLLARRPVVPILDLKGGGGKTNVSSMISAALCGEPGGGKTRLRGLQRAFDDVIDGEVVEPVMALPAPPAHTPTATDSVDETIENLHARFKEKQESAPRSWRDRLPNLEPQPPLDRPEYRSAATDVPAPLRVTTFITLGHLLNSNPVAFVELVYLARDPQHELFGDTGEELRALGLFNVFGKLHTAVRAVVLAAAVGDGLDIELVPIGAR